LPSRLLFVKLPLLSSVLLGHIKRNFCFPYYVPQLSCEYWQFRKCLPLYPSTALLRWFDICVCFPVYGSLVRTIQRETYVPSGDLQMFPLYTSVCVMFAFIAFADFPRWLSANVCLYCLRCFPRWLSANVSLICFGVFVSLCFSR
jgi:hypothetical protein